MHHTLKAFGESSCCSSHTKLNSARKVADRIGHRPEELIRAALEREAKAPGVYSDQPGKQRMAVEHMIALVKKVNALPPLDPRHPEGNGDDLHEQ